MEEFLAKFLEKLLAEFFKELLAKIIVFQCVVITGKYQQSLNITIDGDLNPIEEIMEVLLEEFLNKPQV